MKRQGPGDLKSAIFDAIKVTFCKVHNASTVVDLDKSWIDTERCLIVSNSIIKVAFGTACQYPDCNRLQPFAG